MDLTASLTTGKNIKKHMPLIICAGIDQPNSWVLI